MFCVCVCVFYCSILCNRKVSNHLARVDVSADNSLSTPQYVCMYVCMYQGNGATPCQCIDTTRKAIDYATTLPLTVFGRPFVKRFAPCYRTVVLSCPVLSVLSVCDVRALWPNGWTDDQDETWHAGRPRPWPRCVRWRPSSPSPKGAQPPNVRPISAAAKWLHGSRCHLVWR